VVGAAAEKCSLSAKAGVRGGQDPRQRDEQGNSRPAGEVPEDDGDDHQGRDGDRRDAEKQERALQDADGDIQMRSSWFHVRDTPLGTGTHARPDEADALNVPVAPGNYTYCLVNTGS